MNRSSNEQGTRNKDIAPASYGVCFLGTPHRGSKSASIGRIAFRLTTVATRRPNVKLLQALERNSETLDRIGDDFYQTLLKHNFKIASFREEREIRVLGVFSTVVVAPDSAKIGHGTEELSSIPANHSDMAKFADQSDIGFRRVSDVLRRWVDEIKSSSTGTQPAIDG